MKYYCIVIFVIILLLVSCKPGEIPKEPIMQPTIEPEEKQIEEPEQLCTEMWICQDENTRAYRKSDCSFEQITNCEAGCENGKCKVKKVIEEPKLEPEEETKNESQQKTEDILSEEEQIQQILGYAKTKINSYSYKYKDPAGPQYNIYVKGNKIRIDYLSIDYKIYLDTEKKTAEKYCISHTKCGKETGKIADLDYNDAYIETPIDWLAKITEAKKTDEGSYYGKSCWKLDANIGEVLIDSNFGFIYSIKQKDKKYSFTDASFNTVKDSDVNVPEYLLPK